MELTYDIARAVIAEAQSRDVMLSDASIPDAEKEVIKMAEELIEFGITEWESSSKAELSGELGEDIKAVLGVANIVPDSEVKAAPEDGMEEPWDGYDELTVAQITQAIDNFGDVSDEERDYIYAYEKSHKNRSSIIKQVKPSESAADGHAELDNAMDDAVAKDNLSLFQEATWATATDSLIIPFAERPHLAGVREARQQARERFLGEIREERLPEPSSPDFDEDPVMPTDPAQCADPTLESLYFQFNACLVRATWLLGLAQVDESYCERFEKRARAEAFIRHREERPAEAREALVEKDPEVVYWSDLHGAANEDVKGYNKLVDSYKGNVDRLSRILGFRNDEKARTR